jgi:SanA protein
MNFKNLQIDNLKKYLKSFITKCKPYIFKFVKLLKDYWKKIISCIVLGILFFCLTTIGINMYYASKLSSYIKNASEIDTLETRDVAVVLGAGLLEDNTPSLMLRDRLDTAYNLLAAGKVKKLILSGDNRQIQYNEPQSMINYLLAKKGSYKVSEGQLIPDYAGRRTYDTCYRAKEIFSQNKIYIITQDFHILRAVYLCKSLGIDTIGITADLHEYPNVWTNIVRDEIGLLGAIWDTKVAKPKPILGEKINIQ